MKMIFFVFSILVLFSNSQARSLDPNTTTKTSIYGQLVDVRPLCPPNAMCITNGTVIELKFEPTNICSKIEFKYKLDPNNRNIVIVEATEELDLMTVCAAVLPEPQYETITLNMIFPPLKIVFDGTPVSLEIN